MVNEVSQFLEQDDHVSWTIRATGTHTGAPFMGIPPSGRKIDFLSMNHGVIRDGRGLHHWVVMDTLTMLQQLGVVPEMQSAPA
jgi:predicted ester cyclase